MAKSRLQRQSKAAQVQAIFDSFINGDTPGAAVIVTRSGRTLLKAAYGLADLESRAPLTPQSIFHIGSVGKSFTALAVLMLVEEGKVSLDDPIGIHLPGLARFGEGVTVRRLLQHTSGIPDYYEDESMGNLLKQRAPQPKNTDALALLSEHGEVQFLPGEKFSYSNTGYETLGALIELLSVKPYPVFMQERIFSPLGMADTFSLPDAVRRKNPRIVHSYVREEGAVKAYDSDPLDDLVGSGSFYTTLGDMARYDRALYVNNLVQPGTLALAFERGILNNGSLTDYGLGWEIGEIQRQPFTGHTGSWLGFLAYYARFIDQQLAVIVLMNRAYDLPEEEFNPALRVAEVYL